MKNYHSIDLFERFADHFFKVGDIGYFAEDGKVFKCKIVNMEFMFFTVVDAEGQYHRVKYEDMRWRKDEVQ